MSLFFSQLAQGRASADLPIVAFGGPFAGQELMIARVDIAGNQVRAVGIGSRNNQRRHIENIGGNPLTFARNPVVTAGVASGGVLADFDQDGDLDLGAIFHLSASEGLRFLPHFGLLHRSDGEQQS